MAYGKGGGSGTGSGASTNKESAARGQTVVTQTGPNREKTGDEFSNAFMGDALKGDSGDLSHSITSGKVPRSK